MPGIIRRHLATRGDWTAAHRRQLRCGFDREGQDFGATIPCRQRTGPQPPRPDDEAMVLAAWEDLRDRLLAEVDDPRSVWAYCYFDLRQPGEYIDSYRPFYKEADDTE